MKETKIDITHIPFSRYGAYVSVTREEGKDGEKDANELVIHFVMHSCYDGPIYTLTFGREEAQDFTCSAVPEAISVENENGSARIYIRNDKTVVIDSRGLDVNLQMQHRYAYGTETGDRTFHVISAGLSTHSTFVVPCGKAVLDGPYGKSESGDPRNLKRNLSVACEDGRILMAVTIAMIEPEETALPICPDEEIAAIREEWQTFLGLMREAGTVDEESEEFSRVTWYNLWSSFVRAEGVYHKDTMLMSKKFMSSVWSWDHCFNALAMANLLDRKLAKEKAMDQFQAPFVLQSEHGCLPDAWNPPAKLSWSITKPPIHGWCFSRLMDQFDFEEAELKQVYTWLEKWTGWWMNYNDTDHDGVPDYPQGCDSGWDNSTLFDFSYFVETPDLSAFLILQMQTLARISGQLGWDAEKQHWAKEAEALLERFLAHSWNGERFVSKMSRSHEYEEAPTSLLSLMPLVLGDRLPGEIRDKLSVILERDFLTENGLATEMPTSPKYNPDGYWRGPIWAPPTYLLVDGLRRGGYDKLAETVAKRYCDMSCRKARGNYENFDALTGKGLRAPGYTWSTSVYMLLHWEYNY